MWSAPLPPVASHLSRRRMLGGAATAAALLPTLPVFAQAARAGDALPKGPVKRIATADLAALDILQALGVEPAAVPQAFLPQHLSKFGADAYPKIGSLFEPDVQKLRAIKPDLIVVAGRSASKRAELSAIAPTIDLSTSNRTYLASVVQNVLLLGRLTGRSAEAAAKAEHLLAQARQLQRQAESAGTGMVLFAAGQGLNPQVAQTRFGVIYEVTGFNPALAAADLPPAAPRAARAAGSEVSEAEAEAAQQRQAQQQAQRLAALLEKHNPDWLLVLDRASATGGQPAAPQLLASNAAIQKTRAWARQQVIHLDAPSWYLVGGGLTALEQSIAQVGDALAAPEAGLTAPGTSSGFQPALRKPGTPSMKIVLI